MRAYVLVNPNNNRLIDDKITTYPSCLPEYEVRYGYTIDDNLEVPDWYIDFRRLVNDEEKRRRGYCAYLGHMHSIEAHYKKYPDEDLLMMEDDVEFISEFNICYQNFMKMVPDDWDAIYFGGWYNKGVPTEIVPNVLKVNNTCRLYGAECILLRSKLVKRIVDFFNGADHSPGLQLDATLADWAQQDKIKTYTPIVTFAHQKICFSAIANDVIDRNKLNNNIITYTNINNERCISNAKDITRYK